MVIYSFDHLDSHSFFLQYYSFSLWIAQKRFPENTDDSPMMKLDVSKLKPNQMSINYI